MELNIPSSVFYLQWCPSNEALWQQIPIYQLIMLLLFLLYLFTFSSCCLWVEKNFIITGCFCIFCIHIQINHWCSNPKTPPGGGESSLSRFVDGSARSPHLQHFLFSNDCFWVKLKPKWPAGWFPNTPPFCWPFCFLSLSSSFPLSLFPHKMVTMFMFKR